jgi:hypothetical protein
MSCACPQPVASPNPRHNGDCVRCGRAIGGTWLATSESMGELHDLLLAGKPIPDYQAFRDHCEARELAGRPKFGLQYLDRNNAKDGLEEAADGGNYSFFDIHQLRRDGFDEDVVAWDLNAAYHFAMAHHCLRQSLAARDGTPGSNVDE